MFLIFFITGTSVAFKIWKRIYLILGSYWTTCQSQGKKKSSTEHVNSQCQVCNQKLQEAGRPLLSQEHWNQLKQTNDRDSKSNRILKQLLYRCS